MDSDTRERLDGLEARVATLETERQALALTPEAITRGTLKALVFWLVVVVILAVIWVSIQ
jgi:hypothetical protein